MGWGALAGLINPTALIGTGLSGGLQYLGQREANQTNRDIARDTTAANMAEAQRNRDFQREMSNTAFQRQVEDLKRAGINPLLATGMSGASTPSGSAGSAVGATVQNELSGLPDAIQAGVAIHNQQLASAKQGAEIGLIKDQQINTRAQSAKAAMETKVMSKGIPEADLKNKVYNWVNDTFSQTNRSAAKYESETPLVKAWDKVLEDQRKKMKANQLKLGRPK